MTGADMRCIWSCCTSALATNGKKVEDGCLARPNEQRILLWLTATYLANLQKPPRR